MPAGYSGTPLARKLGLKSGMRVRLLDAPEGYWARFGPSPADLGLDVLGADPDEPADFTHLFATDLPALRAHLAAAREGMTEDGMVWVSWPKKSSGVETGIDKADVLREGRAAGLVDVKVAAVDETWSGHKFVVPVDQRRGGPRGSR